MITIISFIIGIIISFGFALAIVGHYVDLSNNKGDSKATFHDFSSRPLHMIESVDKVKKSR